MLFELKLDCDYTHYIHINVRIKSNCCTFYMVFKYFVQFYSALKIMYVFSFHVYINEA